MDPNKPKPLHGEPEVKSFSEPLAEDPVDWAPPKLPLPARRPAELTTFTAALVAVAGAIGFNLSTEAVVGVFVLIGSLPAIVTWAVDLYRDAFLDLGE